MDIRDRRGVKTAAVQALQEAQYDPKKLLLIHTGISLLLSLAVAVVNYFLNQSIADTGGLSGLGTRAVLSTVQMCLSLAQVLLLPFWQLSYIFITLRFARREYAGPDSLLAGFRTIFPLLRLLFLQGALYFLVMLVASHIGGILFFFTPWAEPLMETMLLNLDNAEALAQATAAMEQAAIPLTVCVVVVFVALALPIAYRLRFSQFALLDDPNGRALAAMGTSRRLLRGNTMTLVKLDLSFWWFYALEVAVSVIAYSDLLLPQLGISLPFSDDILFFGAMVVSMVCQLGLYWWRKNEVNTAYAVFYDKLLPEAKAPEQM